MDAIFLAGGYATRMYPLTLDRPKALLPVGGRPILDYLVDVLEAEKQIRRIFLVSNAKFAGQFCDWAATRALKTPLTVLNDGTTSNEDRLGAIGDLQFVLDHADVEAADGVYVMGTDNLPRFDMTQIIHLSRARGASAIFTYHEDDHERLHRIGVVVLDDTGRVIDFEEKPREPKSNLGVPPFYVYAPRAVGLIGRYLEEGNNPDAPGHLAAWMIHRCPVYACLVEQGVYDIGTRESYEAVRREFERDR